MEHKIKSKLSVAAEVNMNPVLEKLGLKRETHWRFEYWRDGQLLWVDEFDNLVVDVGLNDSLDKHLKGSSYTAAWYVGLMAGAPTVAAGDTMSGGHAGWTEFTDYSELVRQTLTLGAVAAGSVDNSASKAVFSINNAGTVGGAFMVSNSTKGGATGTLYGGGAFTLGDRAVLSGDTISVTVTCTAAAA